MKKRGAYYTVEATFVVTICLVVMMAILYTGLYVHDRMVVETVTQRVTSRWVHMKEEKQWTEDRFQNKLTKELEKKLFLFSVHAIRVSGGLTSKTVNVRYTLSVSPGFLRRIWGGEDGTREEETVVPDIRPAKWKWDADAIRGKEEEKNDGAGSVE